MKTILKFMILGISLYTSIASAFNGNEYMAFSSDIQSAYVRGVLDLHGDSGGVLCVPENVTYHQLTAIFNKYLNDHPKNWHYTASSSIIVSIEEAYPCQTKNKEKTAIEQKF